MPTKRPLPPLGKDGDGAIKLRHWRARPKFFGFIVIEQLVEDYRGERKWRRIRWPATFDLRAVGDRDHNPDLKPPGMRVEG